MRYWPVGSLNGSRQTITDFFAQRHRCFHVDPSFRSMHERLHLTSFIFLFGRYC